MRTALARHKGLFTRRRDDARIREEIAAHLDLLAAEYRRHGMPPDEARRAAQRAFGGAAQTAEEWRECRGLPFLETLARDLQYAWRQLRASPGFASAAVLTLALGIGANVAIFRVLDAVVLRSLPVRDPQHLVLVQGLHNGKGLSFSYPVYSDMAARQNAVNGMFAVCDFPVRDASLSGRLVSGAYFRVLGVDARLGRTITEDDDRPAAAPIAVISHALWQRAYGGSPDVLGRTLRVNNAMVTIIGVAPPEFFGERVGTAPDVWLPMSLAPRVFVDFLNSPAMWLLSVMARLRDDIPLPRAEASLSVLYRQLRENNLHSPGANEYRIELAPGSQGIRDLQTQFSTPLAVLMGLVGLVLLIACSNVANLLLARGAARAHEIGVRLALGAARPRLIRQLLTESFVLAGMGTVLGLALAVWGSHQLVALASAGQQWRLAMDSGRRLLGFAAAASLLATCFFGLAPALAATRFDIHSALQAGARGQAGGRQRQSPARVFIVAQVAVSLTLLGGASLLVRSFWNLIHQDFGYRHEDVLFVQVPFTLVAERRAPSLVRPLFERMNALPGIHSAALASTGPFGDFQKTGMIALPERLPQEGDAVRYTSVSARYFETLGIPIIAGRSITEDDRAGSARVAVISGTAARRLFGTANGIGRVFTDGLRFDAQHTIQIVGVARDLRFANPREPFGMIVYQPLAQVPAPLSSIVMRTAGDPEAFIGPVRKAIREAAPNLRIGPIQPLDELIGSRLRQERMMALLSGTFGLLALVLASVGLYGVVAYGVERRTQEIGIRLALGATERQVSGLLLRELVPVLAMGLALGEAATWVLSRWVRAMLFGLTPHDPAMLAAAAALLGLVAAVAGYLPARRAAHLDPMFALRRE